MDVGIPASAKLRTGSPAAILNDLPPKGRFIARADCQMTRVLSSLNYRLDRADTIGLSGDI